MMSYMSYIYIIYIVRLYFKNLLEHIKNFIVKELQIIFIEKHLTLCKMNDNIESIKSTAITVLDKYQVTR